MSIHPSISRSGFTLIEMSIVLIIIGLIVGAVLAGKDLLNAAYMRAQISQIEKYNTAVNTFRNKYNGLPGDLNLTDATSLGLVITGCTGGMGGRNGDGVLEGWHTLSDQDQFIGETGMFWEDLGTMGLIDGTFPSNGGTQPNCNSNPTQLSLIPGTTYVGDFIPAGKLGYGTFVYVYNNGGVNWWGLSAVTGTEAGTMYWMVSNPGIPVMIAYTIDQKIDDGLPTTGNVNVNYSTLHAITLSPNAAAPSSTTCYDTTSNLYSITQNNGNGLNCALSFKFQ